MPGVWNEVAGGSLHGSSILNSPFLRSHHVYSTGVGKVEDKCAIVEWRLRNLGPDHRPTLTGEERQREHNRVLMWVSLDYRTTISPQQAILS